MNKQLPKQYQQGYTEFYKLKFKLTQDVLIPRPETELLVDEVLRFYRDCFVVNTPRNDVTILDIGTGSGCISISILKNLKSAKIIATDISEKALEVAKINASFHKVDKKIIFLKSDLLSFVAEKSKSPDIIVTNLPYIPTGRLLFIDPMVADFEPRIALDGGSGGFEIYSQLLHQMKDKNFIPKLFLGEIDYEQGNIAKSVVNQIFPNASVEIIKDLAGLDRILKITF